ncbi:MAG: PDZ domain-containing protein [Proteobacteria bacterium]|nr:PDZ domain-containing protein [Pseudomonadota bacterium]
MDSKIEENPKSSKKFLVLIVFAVVVIFSSISILGYYLFLKNSNEFLNLEVEKVEKNIPENNNSNLVDVSNRKSYEIGIYYSSNNDLLYLGEGILIFPDLVLVSGETIKNYKSEDLILRQFAVDLPVEYLEGSSVGNDDSKSYFTLRTRGSFLGNFITFPNKDLQVGDSLNLKTIRSEKILSDDVIMIDAIQIFQILGKVGDGYAYLSNLNFSDSARVAFNNQGEPVGATVFNDSKGSRVLISGAKINILLKQIGEGLDLKSKDKIGIEFEFSDLAKFRKEGRPVGLVVKNTIHQSIASLGGIKEGDIILTINNQVFVSQEELDKFFNKLNPSEELKFEIIREDKKIGITLNLQ